MSSEFSISDDVINNLKSIQDITVKLRKFAADRDWEKHHTPRNIALALMGELGELAELFQWKGDGRPIDADITSEITEEDRDHVGQEVGNVDDSFLHKFAYNDYYRSISHIK